MNNGKSADPSKMLGECAGEVWFAAVEGCDVELGRTAGEIHNRQIYFHTVSENNVRLAVCASCSLAVPPWFVAAGGAILSSAKQDREIDIHLEFP